MARCVRTVPPARAVGRGALELFFVSGSVLGPDPVGIDVQLQDGFWGEGGVGVFRIIQPYLADELSPRDAATLLPALELLILAVVGSGLL